MSETEKESSEATVAADRPLLTRSSLFRAVVAAVGGWLGADALSLRAWVAIVAMFVVWEGAVVLWRGSERWLSPPQGDAKPRETGTLPVYLLGLVIMGSFLWLYAAAVGWGLAKVSALHGTPWLRAVIASMFTLVFFAWLKWSVRRLPKPESPSGETPEPTDSSQPPATNIAPPALEPAPEAVAPPAAAPGIPAWPGHAAWRDGDLLVVAKETEPPERCLKCNAPAGGKPIKKALSWSSVDAPRGGHALQGPVGCLLGLFELIGIAACVATMRTAPIQVRLCDAHRDEVRRFRRVAWGGSVVGGLMVLAASLAAIWIHGHALGQTAVNVATALFCIGALLAVFSIAHAAKKCALITVRKIEEGFVWLEGAGPEYLGSLSDFHDLPPSAIAEINARPPTTLDERFALPVFQGLVVGTLFPFLVAMLAGTLHGFLMAVLGGTGYGPYLWLSPILGLLYSPLLVLEVLAWGWPGVALIVACPIGGVLLAVWRARRKYRRHV